MDGYLALVRLVACFFGALLLGGAGAASLLRLVFALASVALGEGVALGTHEDAPVWLWPRDGVKIIAYALALLAVTAAAFALAYLLASRALNGPA